MLGFPSRGALAVWSFLCLVWGSTWLFIKIGLEELPPFTFAGLRFVLAWVILTFVVAARRRRILASGRDWAVIVATGALGIAGSYGFVYWGGQYISSGLTALLFAGFPLFGILVAHLLLPNEKLTPGKAFGTLLGLGGVAVLFSDRVEAAGALAGWGSLAVVCGALTAAFGDVSIKRFGAGIDPLVLAWGHMAMGAIPLTVIGVVREGPLGSHAWTPRAVFALLYLSIIGSAIAFVLFFWLLQRIEAGQTMMIGLVTPLIAMATGVVVRGEPLSWRIAFGGAAILGGVALALFRKS